MCCCCSQWVVVVVVVMAAAVFVADLGSTAIMGQGTDVMKMTHACQLWWFLSL
jgi:hypothetical protein